MEEMAAVLEPGLSTPYPTPTPIPPRTVDELARAWRLIAETPRDKDGTPTASSSAAAAALNKMKLSELKAALEERGLPAEGRKKAPLLVALEAALAKEKEELDASDSENDDVSDDEASAMDVDPYEVMVEEEMPMTGPQKRKYCESFWEQ